MKTIFPFLLLFPLAHFPLLSFSYYLQIYLHSMRRDGIALKKMPNSRVLALPGVTEASGLDVSIPGLSLYVADAGQGSVDVLKLSSSRSRQGLTPSGQILKLRVGMISFQGERLFLKSPDKCQFFLFSFNNCPFSLICYVQLI